MTIQEIISYLEEIAPKEYQESYDNSNLICGDRTLEISSVLCTLDCTEDVIDEAIQKNCGLVVAHHPIVFKGLKSLTGKDYVERTIIKAIKNDIAIYAIHTNLDHSWAGVNRIIGEKLGLEKLKILAPKEDILYKLHTYVPSNSAEKVRNALFEVGAGDIGAYSNCSFNADGYGTFLAGGEAKPYVGEKGSLHQENETRIEIIFPKHLKESVISALKQSHPYEEVAYDIVALENEHSRIGSGMIGELKGAISEKEFLKQALAVFNLSLIRHTKLLEKPIKNVAFCGGAGSFLLNKALMKKADAFITGDFKYHEFFDAENKILIMDVGHFESEQFTPELLKRLLEKNFHTFAVLLSGVKTNPVHYFIS